MSEGENPKDLAGSFYAALGSSVVSHLASLSVKQRLLILLVMKGHEGFPREQLLAAEEDPEALMAAADELLAEGKLRRREDPSEAGRVFWFYPDHRPGATIDETAESGRGPARRRPDGANDGRPRGREDRDEEALEPRGQPGAEPKDR